MFVKVPLDTVQLLHCFQSKVSETTDKGIAKVSCEHTVRLRSVFGVDSGFRQLIKDIQEQPDADYPDQWIREIVKKQLAENYEQLVQSSFEFNDIPTLDIEDDDLENTVIRFISNLKKSRV